MSSFAVVIPTRNRPERLHRCLSALARARELLGFEVYVADSSDAAILREAVQKVCERFEFVRLSSHDGRGVAAARNACTRAGKADLLINVDDDVLVEPDAIQRLVEAYHGGKGWRVVAGSTFFSDGDWRGPVVMRRIGFGRRARLGESPDFLIGGFFIYPRALGLALPWNERLRLHDDVFQGALWRCKNVALLHEPNARVLHPEHVHTEGLDAHHENVYTNLFDVLVANPSLSKALAYEVLGFAAGAKLYFRHPKTALAYVSAWYRGHRELVSDWNYLNSLVQQPLPPSAER